MLLLTGILQFILIVAVLMFEYRRMSPALFMWAVLLVIFGIPHLIYSLRVVDIEYSEDVLITAAFFSIFFSILYFFIRILMKKEHGKAFHFTVNNRNRYMEKVLLGFLIVIVFSTIYNAYQSTGGLLDSSWASRREYSGEELNIFSRLLSILFYPASSVLLMYLVYKEKKINIILPVFLIFFSSIISRKRIDMLPLLLSFISYYILTAKKISFKQILGLCFLGIISIYTVYALQIFRYGGSISSSIDLYLGNWHYFNERVLEQMFSGKGELGLQKAFYFFIDRNNNYPGFGEGHSYIRIFMIFIPTQLSFGLKPDDFAITMGSFWDPSANEGFSMHPTLFGDCYANFGFLGIFLGVFWGLFSNLADWLLFRSAGKLYFPLFLTFSCCFVTIGRGSVYNSFFFMAITFVVLNIMYKFGVFTRRSRIY